MIPTRRLKKKKRAGLSFKACIALGVPRTPKIKRIYNKTPENEILEFIFKYTTDPELTEPNDPNPKGQK